MFIVDICQMIAEKLTPEYYFRETRSRIHKAFTVCRLNNNYFIMF